MSANNPFPPITGPSLPMRIDRSTGTIAWQSDEGEKLKENIVHLLLTGIGERAMRRDYGAGLRQLLHDPNNDALKAVVQHQIAEAIARWEPRVVLQSISIEPHRASNQHQGTLMAELIYTVRRTRSRDSVAVPINLAGT